MFLTIVDSDLSGLSQFRVGNWVSVGNLVGIDIDERRVLLWNKFRIIVVGGDYIIVEYTNNFPLKRIEVDSSDHVVYVSKNLWMTGVFLNGYFTGVWNNGWLKGYPYITKMDKTYWVDGKFDGGHFISGVGSYTYSGVSYSYHTGLVQNMEFRDNNVSNPYQFSYQSWMDLNWVSDTMANIGRDKFIMSTQSGIESLLTSILGGTYSEIYQRTNPDLNGIITLDVLDSTSTFRRGFSTMLKQLYLGTKYNILQNYFPNGGDFPYPVSSTLNPPGIDRFTEDGYQIITSNSYTKYEANISKENLDISATGYSYVIIDNNDNIEIMEQRYSLVELNVATHSGGTGSFLSAPLSQLLYIDYDKATYSLFNNSRIEHLSYSNNIKREYFYNKGSLRISNANWSQFNLSLENISWYEIDRIPFFQYTTESNVDKSIQAPWKATAPFVDFTQDMVYNNYLSAVSFRLDSTSLGSISAFPTGIAASAIYAEMATSTIYTGVGSGASSGL
jgi:hypothetical protein